jgi:predicted permease
MSLRPVAPALEAIAQDLRYGLRSLGSSPGFAATTLLTLALTTSALSTVLSLTHALLLRPPALPDAESLVIVSATRRGGRELGAVSYPDYAHVRDRPPRTLRGLAAYYPTAPLWVTTGERSRELNGAVVSASFLPLLGVTPALGRFFREDEDSVPDRDHVAILSDELWRDWFSGSPEALGATLTINSVPFTIVGVAPASLLGFGSSPNDVYIPTMTLRAGYRWCDALAPDCSILRMVGRLAEGRSLDEARAEIATLAPSSWARAADGENSGLTAFFPRGVGHVPDPSSQRSLTLLGLVAGLLLLVCCANLGGLLLARGRMRTRELAIRVALGASRPRLVRQLMTESLLLALVGGLLGVLVSSVLARALQAWFYSVDAEGYRTVVDLRPDPIVWLAVAVVSAAAAFLFGLMPARRSIAAGEADQLRLSSPTVSPGTKPGRWLLGAQAAVAVSLVATSTLLVANARQIARGANFDPSHVALLRVRPRLLKYGPEQAQALQREVLRRLASLPGVASVSLVGTGAALAGGEATAALPAWPAAGHEPLVVGFNDVGPRYFETLRTPVLRGREFGERDGRGAAEVAVINEALSRRLWPLEEPVGQHILVNGRLRAVVGVVGDIPLQGRGEGPRPYVYLPYWQTAEQVDARYCVRGGGDPAALLPELVREVNRIDPDVPVTETVTLSFQIAQGLLKPVRLNATVLGYAALLAVLLSALGFYSTLAFSVARRTREIGIRLAVGGQPRQVFGQVLGDGMRAVLLGVTAGVGLASIGARLVRHLLLGAGGLDVIVFGGAVLFVAGVGALACAIPARRAARVDPLQALRTE